LAVVALLATAMVPAGLVRPLAERALSRATGAAVTFGSLGRETPFSFHPRFVIRSIRVPAPAWAGATDTASIDRLTVEVSAIPLLWGEVRIGALEVSGARLHLVRRTDGTKSWVRARPQRDDDGSASPAIGRLLIADTRVHYRDDKRQRRFDLAVAADPRGIRVAGPGMIRGFPVTLSATAAAPTAAGGRWPFRASIRGDAVGMEVVGAADRPLDLGHMRLTIDAHAQDLRLIDAIIEAGLFGTQPVKLKGDVRRDRPAWKILDLSGTIGRSDIRGRATVTKQDGRTRIDGAVHARRFDFNDLASNEGRAKAAALRRQTGPRLVPATRINLTKLARTDGRLRVTADELLWDDPSPLRAFEATLDIDHSRLQVPLSFTLPRGRLSGMADVDQRQGRTTPIVRFALDLEQARLLDFFPSAGIDGSFRGRIRLEGPGDTIRAAVGASSGHIGLVARSGAIPARIASMLGGDIGRGITTDGDDRATLRCIAARFNVRNGIATASPVVVDTSRSRADVGGTLRLSDEQMFLDLEGAPKNDSVLRLSGPVRLRGSIREPQIAVPEMGKGAGAKVKAVLSMAGRWIAGKQEPLARDADCNALEEQVLR
jgi:uncharacterized protein involved in outer membrane biogenesis